MARGGKPVLMLPTRDYHGESNSKVKNNKLTSEAKNLERERDLHELIECTCAVTKAA